MRHPWSTVEGEGPEMIREGILGACAKFGDAELPGRLIEDWAAGE